ncbi:MAG: T9SS type A sorting domain-containing protein [Taibaiella sp.]|nr:T9SS type A sorting domain-containing protein [Taibaiella sp.]
MERIGPIGQIFKLIPFHVPTNLELFDYQPGDAFEFITGTSCNCDAGYTNGGWVYDTVLNRINIDSNHSQIIWQVSNAYYNGYCSDHHRPVYYRGFGIDTMMIDNTPRFAFKILPEEYGQRNEFHYYPDDSSNCYKSKLLTSGPAFLFEGCDNKLVYKNGLGIIDTVFCTPPLCPDGIGYGTRIETSLVYSRKQGVSCGFFNPEIIHQPAFENQVFTVYPNPARDDINIVSKSTHSQFTYILRNSVGQVVSKIISASNDVHFDVQNLFNGLYIVSVIGDGSRENIKVVINH